MNPCKKSVKSEDIVYIEDCDLCKGNLCSTYVSPMYDMTPMQCTGGMSSKYPSLDKPYMNAYMDQYQDINDMWMNYYNNHCSYSEKLKRNGINIEDYID